MYDRLGREAMERMEAEGGDPSSSGGPGGPGGPGFSAEDIFNMFARGGMGGGGGRGGFGMFMNSFMMEETVRITLEEAISGVQRTVKVQVNPYGPPLTVPITIPPGVDTGMGLQEQVSLGQVHLLLTVRIEVLPHRTFRRSGDDLNVDVDVSLVDALLGG
jgi:DnaJ-class molecular chaperone